MAYLRRYADMHRLPMRTGVNVTAVEFASGGGFVLGLPWQRDRASAIIRGAGADAASVADHLAGSAGA